MSIPDKEREAEIRRCEERATEIRRFLESLPLGVFVPKSWLGYRLTVKEAEKQYMVWHTRLGCKPTPFGLINAQWKALKKEMKWGDELWFFTSPSDTWVHFCGKEGIALIRKGEVVCFLYTRES